MENQDISINLKDTIDIKCDECENKYFTPTFEIRKLSALVSPNGQETMIPIQLFQCSKCGHVNEDFSNK